MSFMDCYSCPYFQYVDNGKSEFRAACYKEGKLRWMPRGLLESGCYPWCPRIVKEI